MSTETNGRTQRTLLAFATPEEKARLCELALACVDAGEEAAKVRAAINRAHLELARIPLLKASQADDAAAAFLGETPPANNAPAVEPMVSASKIRDTISGLERRMKEAEKNVQEADGKYRRALVDEFLGPCLQRVAEEYLKVSPVVSELWILLDSGEHLAHSLNPSGAGAILGLHSWGNMQLPGADAPTLPTLSQASEATMFGPFVFSGHQARARGLTRKALEMLATQVRLEVGPWIFDRRN